MMEHFPFTTSDSLYKQALTIWYDDCEQEDWLEAFGHHPKIGGLKALAKKFAATEAWASEEQGAVKAADTTVLQALAAGNEAYEAKFGFIFIVCATGKSAEEMLNLLEARMSSSFEEELAVAMGEQAKITSLRLNKLLEHPQNTRSQLTTHVLDTSVGKPGKAISIRLKAWKFDHWQTIAQGITDDDGRIGNLLPPGKHLAPDTYQMVFDTGAYFDKNEVKGFYPNVEIQFLVTDGSHYHVPLLINPFGYSTYRGS